ncbi:MAG: hypothetical protein AB8H03_16785 [Saprospiraceae bacterium]
MGSFDKDIINISGYTADTPILMHPLKIETIYVSLNGSSSPGNGNVGNGARIINNNTSTIIGSIQTIPTFQKVFNIKSIVRQHQHLLDNIKASNSKEISDEDIWNLVNLKTSINQLSDEVNPNIYKGCNEYDSNNKKIKNLLSSISKLITTKKSKSRKELNKNIRKDLITEIQTLNFKIQKNVDLYNENMTAIISDQKSIFQSLSSIKNLLSIPEKLNPKESLWLEKELNEIKQNIKLWSIDVHDFFYKEESKCKEIENQILWLNQFHIDLPNHLSKIQNKKLVQVWELILSIKTSLTFVQQNINSIEFEKLKTILNYLNSKFKILYKAVSELKGTPDYLLLSVFSLIGYYKSIFISCQEQIIFRKNKNDVSLRKILHIFEILDDALNIKKDKNSDPLNNDDIEEISSWFYSINTALIEFETSDHRNDLEFDHSLQQLQIIYDQLYKCLFRFIKLSPKDVDFLKALANPTLDLLKKWTRKAKHFVKQNQLDEEEISEAIKKTNRVFKKFVSKKSNIKLNKTDYLFWNTLYEINPYLDFSNYLQRINLSESFTKFQQLKKQLISINTQILNIDIITPDIKYRLASIVGRKNYFELLFPKTIESQVNVLMEKKEEILYLIKLFNQGKKIKVDNRYTASFDRVERLVNFYIQKIQLELDVNKKTSIEISERFQKNDQIILCAKQALKLIQSIDKTSRSDYRRLKISLNEGIRLLQKWHDKISLEEESWNKKIEKISLLGQEIGSNILPLKNFYKGNNHLSKSVKLWELNTKVSTLIEIIEFKSSNQINYQIDLTDLSNSYDEQQKKITQIKKIPINLKYHLHQTNKKANKILENLKDKKAKEIGSLTNMKSNLQKSLRAFKKINDLPQDGRVKQMNLGKKESIQNSIFSIKNINKRNGLSKSIAILEKENQELQQNLNTVISSYKGLKKINKKDAIEIRQDFTESIEELSSKYTLLNNLEFLAQNDISLIKSQSNQVSNCCTKMEEHLAPIKHGGNFDIKGPLEKGPFTFNTKITKASGGSNNDHNYELWIRVFPDTFAINNHEPRLTQSEIDAGKKYWQTCWDVHNRSGDIGAWRALCENYDTQRATWIVKKTKPTNLNSASPNFHNNLQAQVIDESAVQPPRVNVMPDYLVFQLYDGNGIAYRKKGATINELRVGVNSENTSFATHDANGDLIMDASIKWMTDFDEAIAKGMGFKIPIADKYFENNGTNPPTKFDRIIVAGIKSNSSNNNNSKTALEELFEGHHYSKGGMSFLPPGTPTNNTIKNNSPYSSQDNVDEAFHLEFGSPLFSYDIAAQRDHKPENDIDEIDKNDGIILGEALGINPNIFNKIKNSDNYSRRNSRLMNAALYPATWGYYLESVLAFYNGGHFLKIPEDTDLIRDFFVENISGRGALPTLRIGNQPYGILPVSVMNSTSTTQWDEIVKKIKIKNNGVWDYYPTEIFKNEKTFYNNLYKFLTGGIKIDWLTAALRTKTIDELGNLGDTVEQNQSGFMELLGLHAHSVEYYQRYAIGKGDTNLSQLFKFNGGGFSAGDLTSFFKDKTSQLAVLPDYAGADKLYENEWQDLIIAQLRMLGNHSLLSGKKVDTLKSKNNRKLSNDLPNNNNFIEWLLERPIKKIYDTSRVDSTDNPPNTLLYLLLRTALLNQYWNTSVNIYESIQLGDFRSKSLSKSDWQKSSSAINDYSKPHPAVNNLNNVMIDWSKIVAQDLTVYDLWKAANGDTSISIPNLKYAFNLLTSPDEDEQVFNQWLTEYDANPTMNIDDHRRKLAEKKIEKSRIDVVVDRLFYKNFTLGVDFDKMIQYYNSGIIEDYYYSILRQSKLIEDKKPNLFTYGGTYSGFNWKDYLTPADSRLPFLFFDLHKNELKGIPSGNDTINISDYLKKDLGYTHYPKETKHLKELKESFTQLSNISTAELELLMAEHLDLCSHRLDAWILGMFKKRLSLLREKTPKLGAEIYLEDYGWVKDERNHSPNLDSIYLGAYGWVLNLEPGGNVLQVNSQGYPSGAPQVDPENQDFIHAPSLNHALTAALLRNGYMSKGGVENSILEINLSSRRVRRALFYLEGIRNGQTLGALLGYQLERGIHDNLDHGASLNGVILDFRKDYPLATNNQNESEINKANNVIDGLKLIEAYQVNASPFAAIDSEVKRIIDDLDAIADLSISEGVYQAVLGNFSRSDAMLSAISEGKNPPEPEIIRTPRTGTMLTHRVGISIQAITDSSIPNGWISNHSAKSIIEPSLNYWVGNQIGDPSKISCIARYTTLDNVETDLEVTVNDLKIQPLDFLMCFSGLSSDTENELAKRLKLSTLESLNNKPISKLEIRLDQTLDSSHFSIGELIPFFNELLELIAQSRPLSYVDVIHPNDNNATPNAVDFNESELQNRAGNIYNYLDSLQQDIENIRKKLSTKFNVTVIKGQNLSGKGTKVKSNDGRKPTGYLGLVQLLKSAASFNLPFAIPNHLRHQEQSDKIALLNLAKSVIEHLKEKKEAYQKVYSNAEPWNTLNPEQKIELLLIGISEIFGTAIPILPLFKPPNKDELNLCFEKRKDIIPNKTLAMEGWLTGISKVREPIEKLENLLLLKSILNPYGQDEDTLYPLQLPYRNNDNWVGLELPENYYEDHEDEDINQDKLSLVLLADDGFKSQDNLVGLLIDEWTEVIPYKEETSGIAFHYNQPNARPPQNLLLAIHPHSNSPTVNWTWGNIVECLKSTLVLSRIRAVEPEHFTKNSSHPHLNFYSHALPATMNQVIDSRSQTEIDALNLPLDADGNPAKATQELSTDFMNNNDKSLFPKSADSILASGFKIGNITIAKHGTPFPKGIPYTTVIGNLSGSGVAVEIDPGVIIGETNPVIDKEVKDTIGGIKTGGTIIIEGKTGKIDKKENELDSKNLKSISKKKKNSKKNKSK